jgi:hypothetical protein
MRHWEHFHPNDFGDSPQSGRVYGFHGRRIDEIFLLFVWIHILQQGIWDMETRKLSRPPSKKFLYIQFKPLPSPYCPFRAPETIQRLELAESLDGLASAGQDAQDVEADLSRIRVR